VDQDLRLTYASHHVCMSPKYDMKEVGNVPNAGFPSILSNAFPRCYAIAKLSPQNYRCTPESMLTIKALTIVITQAFQMADLPNSCLPVT
jgi:hypothetical protein